MKILPKILTFIIVLAIGFFLGQYFAKVIYQPEIEVEEEIEVSLLLDFSEGNVKNLDNVRLIEEKTAFDLLKKATEENNLELSFKESPGLGVFVESIDNVANDFENNKWWQYWVNGEYAQVGASNFILKDGDLVEWKYVEGQF